MVGRKGGDLPMVQGMVGSEKAMMLVDSGAMVTLVNLDLLKNQPAFSQYSEYH